MNDGLTQLAARAPRGAVLTPGFHLPTHIESVSLFVRQTSGRNGKMARLPRGSMAGQSSRVVFGTVTALLVWTP
jgi:hypothetical protein